MGNLFIFFRYQDMKTVFAVVVALFGAAAAQEKIPYHCYNDHSYYMSHQSCANLCRPEGTNARGEYEVCREGWSKWSCENVDYKDNVSKYLLQLTALNLTHKLLQLRRKLKSKS